MLYSNIISRNLFKTQKFHEIKQCSSKIDNPIFFLGFPKLLRLQWDGLSHIRLVL